MNRENAIASLKKNLLGKEYDMFDLAQEVEALNYWEGDEKVLFEEKGVEKRDEKNWKKLLIQSASKSGFSFYYTGELLGDGTKLMTIHKIV